MDWLLVFTGESCLGEHAIKDQQFITLSLSTNPPVFFACLPVVFARQTGVRRSLVGDKPRRYRSNSVRSHVPSHP